MEIDSNLKLIEVFESTGRKVLTLDTGLRSAHFEENGVSRVEKLDKFIERIAYGNPSIAKQYEKKLLDLTTTSAERQLQSEERQLRFEKLIFWIEDGSPGICDTFIVCDYQSLLAAGYSWYELHNPSWGSNGSREIPQWFRDYDRREFDNWRSGQCSTRDFLGWSSIPAAMATAAACVESIGLGCAPALAVYALLIVAYDQAADNCASSYPGIGNWSR